MKNLLLILTIILITASGCGGDDKLQSSDRQKNIEDTKNLEEMIVGQWVYLASPLILATNDDAVDSTYLHFIENGKMVLDTDTLDLRTHNQNYIRITKFEPNHPNAQWDFHILDVTDSTMTVEFFVDKRILEFKKLK